MRDSFPFALVLVVPVATAIAIFAAMLPGVAVGQEQAGAQNLLLHSRVIDETGQPLPGVRVQAFAVVNSAAPQAALQTSADPDGEFSLPLPDASHYRLQVSSPCCYTGVQTLRVSDWADTAGHLRVPPIVLTRKAAGRVMFAFAGDTMFGRRYFQPLAGEPALAAAATARVDIAGVLRHVAPYLQPADWVGVNLETQLFGDEQATLITRSVLPKSVTFYAPPALASALREAGVDYVALGNNHMYDFQAGLTPTLASLRQAGLAFSGGGMDEATARAAYHHKANGNRYALSSYVGWRGNFTPHQAAAGNKGGAALGTLANLQQDLQEQAEHSPQAAQIVQYHGGLEYASRPSLVEQTRLRGAVDAGADLVLAHHPHVLQGFEFYNNRLIAYSLGNFVFDQYIYSTQLSMLLYVWMDGQQLVRAEVVPLYLNGYVPTPATGFLRYDILQRLVRLSDLSGLRFKASGSHASLHGVKRSTQTSSTAPLAGALEVNELAPDVVHSLQQRVPPLQLITGLAPDTTAGISAYRLGVDLLKRGDFSHAGEFSAPVRNWLLPEGVRLESAQGGHLVVNGAATTGMRTFERAFVRSNPATLQVRALASCPAQLQFFLQRRNLAQSRDEALAGGERLLIGEARMSAGQSEVLTFDFATPRTSTKGVRVLIDVQQAAACITRLDDLVMVEWRTAWLPVDRAVPQPQRVQATHLQLRSGLPPPA